MKTINNKRAFTLAEVLITLGIIGVVAAMTLPALSAKIRNNELETGYKKAYTVLQERFKFWIVDNEDFDPAQFNGTRTFKPFFEERLKGTSCKQYSGINCFDIDNGGNIYKTFTGKSKAYGIWFDDGHFTTSDGMLLMLNDSANEPLCVSVDVNGQNKNPNQWGKDMFTFQFLKGKLVPMGAEGTAFPLEDFPQYCEAGTSADQMNGINCAYKAFQDKDYFKNLK